MPRDKDLKRLVRTRMQKTGEAYTAARAQILSKPRRKTSPAPKLDYAELAGTSDATIKQKTGCTWERWVKALDHHGAAKLSHRDIARLVNTTYKIDGWWSQTVTVGYERIKGLRVKGQRRDGSYEVNKSRTFGVPVAALYDAWAEPRRAGPLAGRRTREGAHRHPAEEHAARLVRRHDRRGRVHREGHVQERGVAGAHEAAGQGGSESAEGVLVGAAGCAGGGDAGLARRG